MAGKNAKIGTGKESAQVKKVEHFSYEQAANELRTKPELTSVSVSKDHEMVRVKDSNHIKKNELTRFGPDYAVIKKVYKPQADERYATSSSYQPMEIKEPQRSTGYKQSYRPFRH
ncbi:MAG: hypothetical protein NTW62_00415 [Candidatus Nomurabacteria bacterium]|nr:hypothetical protein [Candidatus Nomurabacteria bacterium]